MLLCRCLATKHSFFAIRSFANQLIFYFVSICSGLTPNKNNRKIMLLNDFFTIRDTESSATEIWAELVINANHKIFEGHFPNQPVVPGVCMMQMIKEILEQVIDKETNLVQAADMKFLAVINPLENNLIHTSIKYATDETGVINIVASLFKDELVHFKCRAKLEPLAAL